MKRLTRVPSASDHDRHGFVLVVVLVIVTLVALAGFAFVNTMTNEYRAVHANGDLLAAEQALASAEVMLCRVLQESPDVDSERPLTAISDPQRFPKQLLLPDPHEGSRQTDPLAWRFSVVSPARQVEEPLEETAGIRFGLENESERLNLTALLTFDAVAAGGSRRALMTLPGMTETAAAAMLDWLDADDEPREFGAEADEYVNRPSPIRPRNGIPRTWDELLLVPGVGRARLFGPDANRNFVIDPHEQRSDDLRAEPSIDGLNSDEEWQGWIDYLTLHSAERNVDRWGRPRVHLNQQDPGRLREELSEFFPKDVVDFVLLYRQFGPEDNARSSPRNTGESAQSHESVAFPLGSVADVIDARVVFTEGEDSRVVASPLTSTSRELLTLLFDRTTVDARSVIPGRINVNLASRPVLESIPGLSPDVVTRIVGRRSSLDEDALQTPAWLVTEQVAGLDVLRNLLPFVTTGGDVYRAQIVVWRPIGGPYRRAEVLLDGTRRPARRIVRTDLSAFGIGFPIAALSRSLDTSERWTAIP